MVNAWISATHGSNQLCVCAILIVSDLRRLRSRSTSLHRCPLYIMVVFGCIDWNGWGWDVSEFVYWSLTFFDRCYCWPTILEESKSHTCVMAGETVLIDILSGMDLLSKVIKIHLWVGDCIINHSTCSAPFRLAMPSLSVSPYHQHVFELWLFTTCRFGQQQRLTTTMTTVKEMDDKSLKLQQSPIHTSDQYALTHPYAHPPTFPDHTWHSTTYNRFGGFDCCANFQETMTEQAVPF